MKDIKMQGNAMQCNAMQDIKMQGNAEYIEMQTNQQRFINWLISDNVIKVTTNDGLSYWTSQDAQYKNKLHTISDAWDYYNKEFKNN